MAAVRDAAAVQRELLDHAVAVKPVVAAFGAVAGIAAVADERSLEIFWQLADDFEVLVHPLGKDRGIST